MKKYSLFFFSAAFLLLSASMPLSASSKQNTPETPGEIIASNSKAIAQTQSATETHNTPVAKDMPDAQIKATIIDNYINDANTQILSISKTTTTKKHTNRSSS